MGEAQQVTQLCRSSCLVLLALQDAPNHQPYSQPPPGATSAALTGQAVARHVPNLLQVVVIQVASALLVEEAAGGQKVLHVTGGADGRGRLGNAVCGSEGAGWGVVGRGVRRCKVL